MKTTELSIQLRHATIEDVSFIFNSWLKSFRTAPCSISIHNNIYYSEHHKLIERILRSFDVIIAADKEDPTHIYGFIVAGKVQDITTIHYLYVKHTFRRLGIAKALLAHFEIPNNEPFFYTHETSVGKVLGKKYLGVYHPYLAFGEQK